jgi:hypothetical protein
MENTPQMNCLFHRDLALCAPSKNAGPPALQPLDNLIRTRYPVATLFQMSFLEKGSSAGFGLRAFGHSEHNCPQAEACATVFIRVFPES